MRQLIIIILLAIVGTGCATSLKTPQYTAQQCAELKAKHSTPEMTATIPACVILGFDQYE